MALTIGQQLRAARKDKGLSIEDLAHETRIHSNFVRALESDDYSGFASITYAKSFLQLYSRHLNIDASEALSVFKGNNAVNLHGNSLLSDSHESIEPMGSAMNSRSVKRKRRTEKPGGAPIFLGMILGVLLIAIPTFYFLGYNAENPEDVAKVIAKNANELKENIGAAAKSNGTSEIQANPLAEKSVKPSPVEEAPEPEVPTPTIAETPAPQETKSPAQIAVIAPPKVEPTEIKKPVVEPEIRNGDEKPEKPNTAATHTPIVAKPVDNGTPRMTAVEAAGGSSVAAVAPRPVGPTEPEAPALKPDSKLPLKPIVKVDPAPLKTATGLPPVKKISRDKPAVASSKPPVKPTKPAASRAPLRATPIIARPIVNPKPESDPDLTELLPDDESRRTNEEPDAQPMEEITPKPKKLNFDPGANRFPRRPE